MDKILITIYVLTIDESYDIKVPINALMQDVLDLVQDTIKDLSGGTYIPNPNARLYEKNSGLVINVHNIVKYSGLQNGSNLLLL